MLTMAEVTTLRVPIDSELGRMGVAIMDDYGDKRIMQESLDIYRGTYRNLDRQESPLVMYVAICNGHVAGMTAGVCQDGLLHNSVTVVDPNFRRRGIATRLIKEKAILINKLWPHVEITSRVAQDNVGSVQSLLAAGFVVVSEGRFTKKNGEEASYFMFRYN